MGGKWVKWNRPISEYVNEKRVPLFEYKQWKQMYHRVTSYVEYSDVSIDHRFDSYEYFYDWCNAQKGFFENYNGRKWAIDKDILGNGLIYSPDICVFVPPVVNTFLTKLNDGNNKGVHLYPSGKYGVVVKKYGVAKYYGTYESEYEARLVYQDERVKYLMELSETYFDKVDERVFPMLLLKLTNSFV